MPPNNEIIKHSVAVIRHHRSFRKYQPWLLGLVTLGLLGAAAVLILLIINANQSSSAWVSEEEAKLQSMAEDLILAARTDAQGPSETDPSSGSALKPGNATSKTEIQDGNKVSKPVLQPIPQPPARIIRPRQLEACWRRVRPFILKLTAETPLGKKSFTGTIVDSRGWVATSYRAVQGAYEITATQSPRSTDELDASSLLSDKVRGLIAADPAHDLAILAVNRRFIVSFSDLDMLDQDNLVTSEHLIQCVAPTHQYPWSATECRIDDRGRFSDFPETVTADLTRLQLSDPKTNWIVHKNKSPLSAGAPILTTDGQLAAINVEIDSAPDVGFAVPIGFLRDLLVGAVDEPLPLPVPAPNLTVSPGHPATPVGGGTAGAIPVVPVASANHSLSVLLNQAGSECEARGWWPKTEQDVVPLKQFATQLILAQDLISSDAAPAEDSKTIGEQIAYWTEKLQSQLRPDGEATDDYKRDFNQLFTTGPADPPRPLIAFVDVLFSAMESPSVAIAQESREDSVTFHVIGKPSNLITNLDPHWPPLRPDSPWLIVGQQLGTNVRISGGDRVQSAELAKIRFVFPAAKDP